MEKLFIREVVAVWAFDQQNKAVWKCSDVGKLKLSQDGETTKKKGSRGETIFQLNRNKSARLTFETNIWGVDLISALSGSKTEKATLYEPIQAPFVESWVIEPSHLRDGFITLTQRPCDNSTISLHKLSVDSSIDTAYNYNGITATSDSFSYNPKNNSIVLPTGIQRGDIIEVLYDYRAYKASKTVNSQNEFPEAWKVKVLVLASQPCDTDKVCAVWITANNARTTLSNEFKFELEESLTISLELGHEFCDNNQNLYEIIVVDEDDGETPKIEYFTLNVSLLDNQDILL